MVYLRLFPSPCGDDALFASPVETGEVASGASQWGHLWRMRLSHDRDAWIVHSAPSTASRSPSPVTHGGGLSCVFPSPCGDVVLKFCQNERRCVYGFWFPSPCGDVVLKLCMGFPRFGTPVHVSVPLRGCGFEISFSCTDCEKECVVSVPLRGCGFEIIYFYTFTTPLPRFRPLAGMWF